MKFLLVIFPLVLCQYTWSQGFEKLETKKVKASSSHRDGPAKNTIDGKLHTMWSAELASVPNSNHGIGEWIEFEFKKPVYLGEIRVNNGFWWDKDVHGRSGEGYKNYLLNTRIKDFQITFSDGHRIKRSFKDVFEKQTIKFPAHETTTFRITILDKIIGTNEIAKRAPGTIAEVEFWGFKDKKGSDVKKNNDQIVNSEVSILNIYKPAKTSPTTVEDRIFELTEDYWKVVYNQTYKGKSGLFDDYEMYYVVTERNLQNSKDFYHHLIIKNESFYSYFKGRSKQFDDLNEEIEFKKLQDSKTYMPLVDLKIAISNSNALIKTAGNYTVQVQKDVPAKAKGITDGLKVFVEDVTRWNLDNFRSSTANRRRMIPQLIKELGLDPSFFVADSADNYFSLLEKNKGQFLKEERWTLVINQHFLNRNRVKGRIRNNIQSSIRATMESTSKRYDWNDRQLVYYKKRILEDEFSLLIDCFFNDSIDLEAFSSFLKNDLQSFLPVDKGLTKIFVNFYQNRPNGSPEISKAGTFLLSGDRFDFKESPVFKAYYR